MKQKKAMTKDPFHVRKISYFSQTNKPDKTHLTYNTLSQYFHVDNKHFLLVGPIVSKCTESLDFLPVRSFVLQYCSVQYMYYSTYTVW